MRPWFDFTPRITMPNRELTIRWTIHNTTTRMTKTR